MLLAALAIGSAAPVAAEGAKPGGAKPGHARACPDLAKARPAGNLKPRKLSELPSADVYAAVYYLDGCPRRLIEARGEKRR